jgi:hypothetical protein
MKEPHRAERGDEVPQESGVPLQGDGAINRLIKSELGLALAIVNKDGPAGLDVGLREWERGVAHEWSGG